MARKAVQGYTEKSYYDNTKYSGVVATTDPLNEGYFKHLVNFDISDTGQSLTPRKGYLTTALRGVEDTDALIPLSRNTIIFKEHETQAHIIYDFQNGEGYIADISAYNLENKLLPIKNKVINKDWDTVLDYLLKKSTAAQAQYDIICDTPPPEGVGYDLVEINQEQFNTRVAAGESSYLFDMKGLYSDSSTASAVIVKSAINLNNPDGYANLYAMATAGIKVIESIWHHLGSDVHQYWRVVPDASYTKSELLKAIQPALTVNPSTKIEHIMDSNGIGKTVLKVEYVDDTGQFPFLLSIYYRKDDVTILGVEYPGNTLVFEVVDTSRQPSLDFNNRNIASPDSIIPSPMQNLYERTERPDGHVNTVGPFLYVQSPNGQYMINHCYPYVRYKFTPHFNLEPASFTLNDPGILGVYHWAYRFDIVSTAHEATKDPLKQDILFRSQWMQYQGPNVQPTPIFPDPRTYLENCNLTGYVDKNLRNFKGARYIIQVVPADVTEHGQTAGFIGTGGSYVSPKKPDAMIISEITTLYNYWASCVNNIKSMKTLRDNLKKMEDEYGALFYVSYEGDAYRSGRDYGNFDEYAGRADVWQCMERDSQYNTSYTARFMTSEQLIEYIEQKHVFDASVGASSLETNTILAFKLLPYSCTITFTYPDVDAGTTTISYEWWFRELDGWAVTPNIHPTHIMVYNLYSGYSLYEFYRQEGGTYIVGTSVEALDTNSDLPDFESEDVIKNGYHIIFYIRPYKKTDIDEAVVGTSDTDIYKTFLAYEVMKTTWDASTTYIVDHHIQYGFDSLTVTTIPEALTKEPQDIRDAKHQLVFDDSYLVLWHNNMLYISEQGDYYYFKKDSKKEFPERIVKVIQFKNILLVFTVQHLYAVYQGEVPTTVNGEPAVEIQWLKQTVLYNIMASDRYADVIQVFNEMVLFYSEDGQLFMIKPSTMIDSETRFSLKYFNQAANDILMNYDTYINERLQDYGSDLQIAKDQVQIKALISVNFIKIFYYVPGVITYILIYDVINNRYVVYDTMTFTEISDKMFIDSGELYLTVHDEKLYFTLPHTEMYQQDNIVDISITDNLRSVGIHGLIDTGNLNLNNHLNKRFRDLHVVYKNLSASKLLFGVETLMDDVLTRHCYDSQIQVQEIGGTSYYVPVTVPADVNSDEAGDGDGVLHDINHNIFEERNLLMDFGDYTSSKLLTHRTSILGLGKVLRLRLQFISKGKYKVQSFGIIYKERRV